MKFIYKNISRTILEHNYEEDNINVEMFLKIIIKGHT